MSSAKHQSAHRPATEKSGQCQRLPTAAGIHSRSAHRCFCHHCQRSNPAGKNNFGAKTFAGTACRRIESTYHKTVSAARVKACPVAGKIRPVVTGFQAQALLKGVVGLFGFGCLSKSNNRCGNTKQRAKKIFHYLHFSTAKKHDLPLSPRTNVKRCGLGCMSPQKKDMDCIKKTANAVAAWLMTNF